MARDDKSYSLGAADSEYAEAESRMDELLELVAQHLHKVRRKLEAGYYYEGIESHRPEPVTRDSFLAWNIVQTAGNINRNSAAERWPQRKNALRSWTNGVVQELESILMPLDDEIQSHLRRRARLRISTELMSFRSIVGFPIIIFEELAEALEEPERSDANRQLSVGRSLTMTKLRVCAIAYLHIQDHVFRSASDQARALIEIAAVEENEADLNSVVNGIRYALQRTRLKEDGYPLWRDARPGRKEQRGATNEEQAQARLTSAERSVRWCREHGLDPIEEIMKRKKK